MGDSDSPPLSCIIESSRSRICKRKVELDPTFLPAVPFRKLFVKTFAAINPSEEKRLFILYRFTLSQPCLWFLWWTLGLGNMAGMMGWEIHHRLFGGPPLPASSFAIVFVGLFLHFISKQWVTFGSHWQSTLYLEGRFLEVILLDRRMHPCVIALDITQLTPIGFLPFCLPAHTVSECLMSTALLEKFDASALEFFLNLIDKK